MKDTPQVRKFIRERALYYSKKLKLKQSKIPDIFFDGVTLPTKKDSIFNDKEYAAHYFHDEGNLSLMHINIKAQKNKQDLDDSIAHELIHLQDPALSHGRKFDKRVEELKKK